jgi:hypothetical protein
MFIVAASRLQERGCPHRRDPFRESPQRPRRDANQFRRALKRDTGNRAVDDKGDLLRCRLPPHQRFPAVWGLPSDIRFFG